MTPSAPALIRVNFACTGVFSSTRNPDCCGSRETILDTFCQGIRAHPKRRSRIPALSIRNNGLGSERSFTRTEASRTHATPKVTGKMSSSETGSAVTVPEKSITTNKMAANAPAKAAGRHIRIANRANGLFKSEFNAFEAVSITLPLDALS